MSRARVNWPSTDGYEKWEGWAQSFLRAVQAALATGVIEVGMISDFHGTAVPDGWLLCDGSQFSAQGYPELVRNLGSNTLPSLTSVRGAGYVVGIKAA